MKKNSTTKQPLEDSKLPHVSTYGRYDEIRGILNRKRQGIDCSEDESRAIKVWVKYETLAVGNGSIELDEEIQELLPLEWGEAQDEIGNLDEHGNIKELGLIKIYSPTPDSKEGLHTHSPLEWSKGDSLIIYDGNANEVCLLYGDNYEANAKIICDSVNERQALLDENEKLLGLLKRFYKEARYADTTQDYFDSHWKQICEDFKINNTKKHYL